MFVNGTEFMLIIKEMGAEADADKTKMQELQNEVNGLRKYHSRFNYRSREEDLLIMKWENEKAEQENLWARIIATNRNCPKCAEPKRTHAQISKRTRTRKNTHTTHQKYAPVHRHSKHTHTKRTHAQN